MSNGFLLPIGTLQKNAAKYTARKYGGMAGTETSKESRRSAIKGQIEKLSPAYNVNDLARMLLCVLDLAHQMGISGDELLILANQRLQIDEAKYNADSQL